MWFSFPCTCWGPWSRFNIATSEKKRQTVETQRKRALQMLRNVSEAWYLQVTLGGHAHAENPLSSDAWKHLRVGEAWTVRIDQCSVGLRSPKNNLPVLKPTRIISSQESFVKSIASCRCDQQHKHDHLEGKYKGINLTSWAETYPQKFCRVMTKGLLQCNPSQIKVKSLEDIFAEDDALDEADELAEAEPPQLEPDNPSNRSLNPRHLNVAALVRKLHVNTGHASVEQLLRLAHRCKASQDIVQAIRAFTCPVCEELKTPPSHRPSAIPHAEKPNEIVGVDYVQVELKKENESGKVTERKFNVLTCVDLATSFAQQIVVPPGPGMLSKCFHQVWSRPYGPPKIIYMDPAYTNISKDFQQYLQHYGISLLHCAAESHYQIGQVEIANKVLRNMAQRAWQTTDRSAEEVIEICASVRNDHLRKSGFSPSQYFLGREPRHAGMLSDIYEQNNPATASQYLTDPDFASQVMLRESAARAFQEEHAKSVWRRAVTARNRPMRGPYVAGQSVYMFRLQNRGMFSTRHGRWLGPGKVIGVESSREGPIPRIVWVSYNGFLYRCSPEGLRPVVEDEQHFRSLAKELSIGYHGQAIEGVRDHLNKGQYRDLVGQLPKPEDHQLNEDVDMKSKTRHLSFEDDDGLEGAPKRARFRLDRSADYWEQRSRGMEPRGHLHEGPTPHVIPIRQDHRNRHSEPNRHVGISDDIDVREYSPTEVGDPADVNGANAIADAEMPDVDQEVSRVVPELSEIGNPNLPETTNVDESMPPASNEAEPSWSEPADEPMHDVNAGEPPALSGIEVPVPEAGPDELAVEGYAQSSAPEGHVFEVSLDIVPEDITDNPLCLWTLIEEAFQVNTPKAKQRRVEVSFRNLNPHDKALFIEAMKREWNSWIENKVTSLCKAKGIPTDRIIRARWVLVWKKSSDPDVTSKTPKARLVLVGWQDPELGRIATDSPTLRKDTKHLFLSVCAAQLWKLWGADIKTAFLSGDAQCRNIYFRPPQEIREWMKLSNDDLFRLEKAAYGLAEAPRAWFMRLTREMKEVGMIQSQLDPCLFTLRKEGKLVGLCGVHVDDIIGGGTHEMMKALEKLKSRLPFGDYRAYTIRYTGVEIRQDPQTMNIEIGQENYIHNLEPVATKPLGTADTKLTDPSILRTCAGQLAWVANATRPDQAFLASYLQGIQDKGDKGHVSDVLMFNRALREMKHHKICLKFPSNIPIESWRIIAIADAGWGKRANGEFQGGYILGLTTQEMFEHKEARVWIVDWSSKKLRRVVRSSVAAETLSAQNAMDAVELFQAPLAEVIHGTSPRDFRNQIPQHDSGVVVDSKGFYDAVNKSCSSPTISIEKRLQIDYAIAKETMRNQRMLVFWISNIHMCADCLTKLNGDTTPLYKLLETGKYQIVIGLESGKKEKAKARLKQQGEK